MAPASPARRTARHAHRLKLASRARPQNGRCIEYCPRDQFFDGASCTKCDRSCGSCLGASSSECSTCLDGLLLRAGKCETAQCKSGIVPGLQICLESLVATSFDERYLGFVALVAVLAAIAYGWYRYIRRQRQQTRDATRDFAHALDEREVGNKMMIIRLEKILGLDRVRPHPEPTPRLAEEEEQKVKERRRLRDLLLPARRKREGRYEASKGKRREDFQMEPRVASRLSPPVGPKGVRSEKKVGWTDQRDSQWLAPPPPYALDTAPSASGSSSSIATSALQSDNDCNALPPTNTKIVSMSSPTSPDLAPRALRPPPRRSDTAASFGSNVRVPVGQGGGDGKEVDRRRSLKKLWPAMTSPVFGGAGQAADRQGEAWI